MFANFTITLQICKTLRFFTPIFIRLCLIREFYVNLQAEINRGTVLLDVQNLVMTFRASQPVDFFFYAFIAVMQYCTFSPVRFTPTIIFTSPMPIKS